MGKRQRTEPDNDHITGKRILNGYGKPCSVLASPVMSISSQSDNEADIVWGHSPPPLNLKLCGTPGPKTRRRSDYGSRDIADMIGCINSRNSSQKQSPNASTPPLLGLWMQDRPTNVQSTPVNGRGGQRFSRRMSNRRQPGDNWASLAKDLHTLAELSQTSRLQPTAHSSDSDGAEQDPPPEDELMIDNEPDKTVSDPITIPAPKEGAKENFITPKRGRPDRSASVESPMDNMWEDDSWFENESFVTIATQLEEEAFSQRPSNNLTGLNSVGDKTLLVNTKINNSSNNVPLCSTHVETITRPAGGHHLHPPTVNRTFKQPAQPQAVRRSPEGLPPTQTRKTFQFLKKPSELSNLPPSTPGSSPSQKHEELVKSASSKSIPCTSGSDAKAALSGTPSNTIDNRNVSTKAPQVCTTGRSQFSNVDSLENSNGVRTINQTSKTGCNLKYNVPGPLPAATGKGQFGRGTSIAAKSLSKTNTSANLAGKVNNQSGLKVSPPSVAARNQFNQAIKNHAGRAQGSVNTGEVDLVRKSPCKPPSSSCAGAGQFSKSGRINETSPLSNRGNQNVHPVSKMEITGSSSKLNISSKRTSQSGIPARPGSMEVAQFNTVEAIGTYSPASGTSTILVQRDVSRISATGDEVDTGQVSPADPDGSLDLFDSSVGDEDGDDAEEIHICPEEAQSGMMGEDKLAGAVRKQARSDNRRESDLLSESSLMDEELLAAVELEEKNWELACSQRTHGNVGLPSMNTDQMREFCDRQFKATPSKHKQGVPDGLQAKVAKDTNQVPNTWSTVAPQNAKFSRFKAPLSSQFLASSKGKNSSSKMIVSQCEAKTVGSSEHSGTAGLHAAANPNGSRTLTHSPSKDFKTVSGNPVNTISSFTAKEEAPKNVHKAPQNKRTTFQFKGSQFIQGQTMSPVKRAPKSQLAAMAEEEPAPNSSLRQFRGETDREASKSDTCGTQRAPLTSNSLKFQFKTIQTNCCAYQTHECQSNSILNSSVFSETSSQFSAGSQLKTTDESTWTEVSPSPVFTASKQSAAGRTLKDVKSVMLEEDGGKSSDGHYRPSSQGTRNNGQFVRVQKLSPDQCIKAAAAAGSKNAPRLMNPLAKSGNDGVFPDDRLWPSQEDNNNVQFGGARKLSFNQCIKTATAMNVKPGVSRVVREPTHRLSRTGVSPPMVTGSGTTRRLLDECVGPSQGMGDNVSHLSRKNGTSQFAKVPKLSQKEGQRIDVWQDSIPQSTANGSNEQRPKPVSNVLRTLYGSANELPQFSRLAAKAPLGHEGAGQSVVVQQYIQPTNVTKVPTHREGSIAGDNVRFTCSQEEIERKRQEALARKKQKENLSGNHRMSLRNRPMKKS